jgi:hypothetical protein
VTPGPGWLPPPVQDLANAAVRAGLVPLVDLDDDQSAWLLVGEARPGLLAAVGPVPFLYLEETDAEGECIVLRGAEKIRAWIATARPATTTKETDQP